jgi:hypothetical protein
MQEPLYDDVDFVAEDVEEDDNVPLPYDDVPMNELESEIRPKPKLYLLSKSTAALHGRLVKVSIQSTQGVRKTHITHSRHSEKAMP